MNLTYYSPAGSTDYLFVIVHQCNWRNFFDVFRGEPYSDSNTDSDSDKRHQATTIDGLRFHRTNWRRLTIKWFKLQLISRPATTRIPIPKSGWYLKDDKNGRDDKHW